MRRVSENMHDEHRYDDLLDLPRHVSKNHRQMSRLDRAAQFAPFAALTGYEESIQNAARKPEEKRELSETQVEELNQKIACLQEHITEHPVIVVRYYYQETVQKHTRIIQKDSADKGTDGKRKRILEMEKEETVRQAARGYRTVMGYYVTERKTLKRVDSPHQQLIFTDRTCMPFDQILFIDCELFTDMES
jgi:hypothetical protein